MSLGLLAVTAVAAGCCNQGDPVPGESITPKQALRRWEQDPENVYVLDVRTAPEYYFIGHPPMARNIPFKFMAHDWDKPDGKPVMKLNPDFLPAVRRHYRPADTLLVMCGSGKRGRAAAELLRQNGFRHSLNILGGFEGKRGEDCSNRGAGKLVVAGWTQCGLPWTRAVNPQYWYVREDSPPGGPAGEASPASASEN
jgi:rhodanese-related sulfurtransferase